MTKELHSLLRRQLRRHGIELDTLPGEFRALLDSVSQAYQESDEDRLMVERSLELNSQELLSSNAEIRQSEERFRRLAENSPVGIYQLSPERHPIYLNPVLLGMLEAEDSGEVAERPFESLFSAESLETLLRNHAVRAEGRASTYEVELIGLRGTRRSVLVSGAPIYDGSGEPLCSIGTVIDISDRKQAERALQASEERFRSLVQNASDLITVVDSDTNLLYASPSMARVLGDGAMSLRGGKLSLLLHPEDVAGVLSFLNETWNGREESNSFEARLRHNDGSWRVLEFVATDQRLNPAISGFVLNARDVTERRDLEEQLRYQAFHDPLTGLANRARFGDRSEHALERASRQQASTALLFMDVDNFKSINDGMGHSVGDKALQHVASRLQLCLRPGDTAARLGGDEFAVLLEDSSLDDAIRVAEAILESFSMPLAVEDDNLIVRASVGIAVSDGKESDADADGLLRNADIAMYAAKDAGKARYEVYRPSMRSALLQHLTLLRDMERAVERREFFVEYQPLIDLETADIVGFEALVRWNHPRLGRLPPADFISLAEESGLIIPLGLQVLEEACGQAREWQESYPHDPPRKMSVNVSVKQLVQEGFEESLLRVLGETGLDPGSLVLEVTESVMLQEAQSAVVQTIRSHGVRVAIDDFGTGYSSLSYLSRFPFDILKIDKSFVDQTRVSEHEGVLARAIIDIGRTFAVEVVAEGIEDQEELDRLREFNCKIGQGFLFARPGSPQQVGELLRKATDSAKAA